MRRRNPLSRLLAATLALLLLVSLAPVAGIMDAFALESSYDWNGDATGADLTGVTTVNVQAGAAGTLLLVEPNVTLAAAEDMQAEENAEIVAGSGVGKITLACVQDESYYVRIPKLSYGGSGTLTLNATFEEDRSNRKFIIGEVHVSNPGAKLILTEDRYVTETELGTISGAMQSLDVAGSYRLSDGGVSAQIERLTVTGGLNIWTANASFEAAAPSLSGIANTREIYISGFLSVISGNNNASATQSPAAIVLPADGKIVVENGGELKTYGADGSYAGNRSAPGVWAKGNAYIRVSDDATFLSQCGGFSGEGLRADGQVTLDLYRGTALIKGGSNNSDIAAVEGNTGSLTVNFRAVGQRSNGDMPSFCLDNQVSAAVCPNAVPVHIVRGVPGRFELSGDPETEGDPETDASFRLVDPGTVSFRPDDTTPFYLYCGVDESTPNANISFTITGGSLDNETVTTGADGIVSLPFGDEDGTYTVSGPGQAFAITVSGGVMRYTGEEAGVSIADAGYALLVLTAAPTPLTFTAQQVGGVAGMKDTTGILLTFSEEVTNLPVSAVSVSGATINTLSKGSGNTWLIILAGLGGLTEGSTAHVSVGSWGIYSVTTPPQAVVIHRRGEEATYTATQVGGTSGLSDTTGILLTFDREVNLTDAQIQVTGATKGSVTDYGDADATTWLIPISNITQPNEYNITVRIADGAAYPVRQGDEFVCIYRKVTQTVTYSAVQQGGADMTANTTEILLTFSQVIDGLTEDEITLTGDNVMKGALNPVEGDLAKWRLAVAGDYANGVVATLSISEWMGEANHYAVSTAPQNVTLYKDTRPSVTYTVTELGGEAGFTATKALLVTFSQPVTSPDQALSTITGATAGNWTDNGDQDGRTWCLSIRNISAETVTVTLKNWGMYIVDTSPHTVTVHRPGSLSYTAIQVGGEDTMRDTTGILLTFDGPVALADEDLVIAYAAGGTMGSAFRGELTDNGDDDPATWLLKITPRRSILEGGPGDNGAVIRITVGDADGLLPSGGGQERRLDNREATVVVYKDMYCRVNYTVERVDGEDGLRNTSKLEVTFTTTPADASYIFDFRYFKEKSMFTVEGAYLENVSFYHDGSYTLYLTPTSFANRDQITVSVDDHWLYRDTQCVVETEPQTITVYRDTRVWTDYHVDGNGESGRKDTTRLTIRFVAPIVGVDLTRENIKVTKQDGTPITTGALTKMSDRTWTLEVSDFEAGNAYVEIVDLPGYRYPERRLVYLHLDTRPSLTLLDCVQIGGVDNEHPTMRLQFTFDRELTAQEVLHSKYIIKKGPVTVFEGWLKEDNDGNAKTWSAVLVTNAALADSLNASGKMRNGDLYDVEITVDPYNTRVEPATVSGVEVYNVEKKLLDDIHLEAVSPSTVHFDSASKKLALTGYFGQGGATDVYEIYISKDGGTPQKLPIIRDINYKVPAGYRQTVNADASNIEMLHDVGIYDVWARIFGSRGESYTNTVTLEIVDDPIYLQNRYGILAVTQKSDLEYVTEFFSGEDEMKANKTPGTTLLTFRGRISEYESVWSILGDSQVNNVLDYKTSSAGTITVTKPTTDGVKVTSSGGNLRWNGINVTDRFEITLESGIKYRNKRNQSSMGLEDVVLVNQSGNAGINVFVLAAEVASIKVYEGEFSAGGWITIGGTLPPFLGDSLSVGFELHDMLLTGAGFTTIPPLHAEGGVAFNPGALFGDFVGAGGGFDLELNTMPETHPNFMGISGTLDIKNAIYLEGEFVFQWGLLNGRMAFVPDTIKVFGRVDSAAGVPLVPPTVVAYINGIGGGISGLGDTVYGKSAIPPIALSLSAAMTDVTGKLISIDKATITVGPSIFSIGADEATLLEFIKLGPVRAYIRTEMVNHYLDVTAGAEGNVSVLDGIIRGRVAFSATLHGAYLAGFAESYFAAIGKGNFRPPNAQEITALYNSFDVLGELDASAQVEFLGLLVRAYGNLYVSKTLLSGRVGAGVNIGNKWHDFEAGIRYSIPDNDLSVYLLDAETAPDGEITLASGENGEKLVFTNVRTVGASGSGAMGPMMGTFGTTSRATLENMKQDYIVSIYSDTKHPEINLYKDGSLVETLTDIAWSETTPSYAVYGKYVVLYLIEADGDYSFEADGELTCMAYEILPLPSLDSIAADPGTKTVTWTYDSAGAPDSDLFVRLLLRDAGTDEILTNLTMDEEATYVDASDGSYLYALPDTLATGSYYITAQLITRGGTPEGAEETLDAISSDAFSFTNTNAPPQVENVTVTQLPNGEFRVAWDEAQGADGYLVTILDRDVPVSGYAAVDVSAESGLSLVLPGGTFYLTDEGTGQPMAVGLTFGNAYQASVQPYKNAAVSEGMPDGETYSVPVYGSATLTPFTLTEPQIPDIVLAVDSARREEIGEMMLYAVNTKTPILTVSAWEAVSISVRLGDQTVAGEDGVYPLSFADDGYYSLDIEAVGPTGDIGYETVNLLIDTTAPVLFVDEASAQAVDGSVRIFGFSEVGVAVTVNGEPVALTGSSFAFATTFNTDNAVNLFTLVATDAAGNQTGLVLSVTNEGPQGHTIAFHANGGTGAMTGAVVSSGGSYTLPDNTGFTRGGYTFIGWSLTADGAVLPAGEVIRNITTDITLYAQWSQDYIEPEKGDKGSGGGSGAIKPQPPEEPYINPFEDVRADAWYYDSVARVYTGGLMLGTSASPMLFSPDMPMTRGMILTILYRYAGSPDVSGLQNPFSDVAEGAWYADAAKWAAENGIALGYGNGELGPGDLITRQDLAVILVRFADRGDIELPPVREDSGFQDDTDIADYAQEAVLILFKAGILNGKPGNVFDPKGPATRAEAAAVLHRFLELGD